jgi:hypothetical protein
MIAADDVCHAVLLAAVVVHRACQMRNAHQSWVNRRSLVNRTGLDRCALDSPRVTAIAQHCGGRAGAEWIAVDQPAAICWTNAAEKA